MRRYVTLFVQCLPCFSKNRTVCEIMWGGGEYGACCQVTDYSYTAHALRMLWQIRL